MKRKLKKSNVYFYLCRLYQLPRVLIFRFLSSTKIAGSPRRLQPVQAIGAGLISIGSDVMLGYFPSPQFFSSYCYLEARFPSARISIGNNTRINNDFRAICEYTSITIGSKCLIGTNVEIVDSDFHALNAACRAGPDPARAKAVFIGNNVFVGNNVRILKGVTIGHGAVIGNGAVVVNDVPERAIAVGNPAKVVSSIAQS